MLAEILVGVLIIVVLFQQIEEARQAMRFGYRR